MRRRGSEEACSTCSGTEKHNKVMNGESKQTKTNVKRRREREEIQTEVVEVRMIKRKTNWKEGVRETKSN